MPARYDDEAIAHCLSLYLKFNGQQHDRIEREMRRKWPGWSKQNLYTRGKGSNLKVGWVEKYGWEEALRLHLAARPKEALTAAEQIFLEIEAIRKKVYEQISAKGASFDRDLVYQHRDYTKLSIEALAKLSGAGQTFETFVAFWEWLLDELTGLAPAAAAELLKVTEQVIDRAAEKYGETKKPDGG